MTAPLHTNDTRERGTVRAFEPLWSRSRDAWLCRGRLVRAKRGSDSTTRQCQARLDPDQKWCGVCGALLAWDGSAMYGDIELKHLERTPA